MAGARIRRRSSASLLGLALLAVVGSYGVRASAFCRSRTCGTKTTPPCIRDENHCSTNGALLYWPTASIRVWVDPVGSPKLGISGEQTLAVTEQALAAWTNADCSSGTPSIAVSDLELLSPEAKIRLGLTAADGTPLPDEQSVEDETSVVSFVDQDWDYMSEDAVGLTTTIFGVSSGKLHSADIELNSAQFGFTLSDTAADFDLLSVLTHESGHLFGLDDLLTHGDVVPTMYGKYDGRGDLRLRSLESDDVAGICQIYPADRFAEDSGCGCRITSTSGRGDTRLPLAAFVFLTVWLAVRRKRPRLRVLTNSAARE